MKDTAFCHTVFQLPRNGSKLFQKGVQNREGNILTNPRVEYSDFLPELCKQRLSEVIINIFSLI